MCVCVCVRVIPFVCCVFFVRLLFLCVLSLFVLSLRGECSLLSRIGGGVMGEGGNDAIQTDTRIDAHDARGVAGRGGG